MIKPSLFQVIDQNLCVQIDVFDDDHAGQLTEAIEHAAAIREDQCLFVEAAAREIDSALIGLL